MRATQATVVSRVFQTCARVPPGRCTRAASAEARASSNQCQACPETTRSALASGSGIASADPIRADAPGTARRSWSSMPSDGSTAVTSSPRATSERVSLPVPAPRSTTVRAPGGTSQSTDASG